MDQVIENKPRLVTHFLHTGPALSDFNSIVPITTNNQNGINSVNSNQAPITNTTSKLNPTICSPFERHENDLIEKAWNRLTEFEKNRAKNYHKRSIGINLRRGESFKTESTLSIPDSNKSCKFNTNQDHIETQGPSTEPVDRTLLKTEDRIDTPEGEEELIDDDDDLVLNLELDEKYYVPVGLDSLFTVDVRRLRLSPAFWHGPCLQVFRGEWFYASSNKSKFYPCDSELCQELEVAYDHIRPWDLSYADEIRSALQIGTEAEDKLKFNLPNFNHDVIFQSPSHGRIYSTNVSSRLSKKILTNFFGSISREQQNQYSGGTVVVRGWDNIKKWTKTFNEGFDQETENVNNNNKSASGNNTTADALEEEGEEEGSDKEVSTLVLVIHGIGQKLAQSYETFDFVHACNQLRLECNKVVQSDPRMVKLLKKRRIQFIPIRWRHSLNFEMEGFDDNDDSDDRSGDEESDDNEGGTNKFTMKDIQVKGSINFVREIITGLVLDVPLYMSPKQHKLMIKAVIEQSNKVYKLFCNRNPYYIGKKVSILAHSLGAALTVDILSLQPTEVNNNPDKILIKKSESISLKKNQDDQELGSNMFCFNTSKLFLVGSPVAFFFHLHRAQLIARSTKNNEWRKKKRIESDEVGRYGCLAADTIYNVYMSTDPVAYCEYSNQISPIDVTSITRRILEIVESRETPKDKHQIRHMSSLASISSLFSKRSSWFYTIKADSTIISSVQEVGSDLDHQEISDGKRNLVEQSRSISESLIGKKRGNDLSNAQLRQALNPTGSVDFVVPSLGLNQYVDMVTAHAAYWSEPRFAKFILTQLFGDPEILSEVGKLERSNQK
ncbi:hypothetical protein CROQUDRAFT_46096 [Cronartium quercuum f. sp. fusiforme G11]|uniref:DDHD domain-containing protein n=1 Tax=Cronartium quercuum f. sp. fusiforme G11 TaxID=708437 RepID=A0A9P6NKH4_9BASI|nr:hypothetical protein CROQUDRAFT_46096 [Cronartium quercuum f. sp. fusiforme G11]